MVRRSTKPRYLRPGENPWLEGIVQKLSAKCGIPTPKLAIVAEDTPNAFVFGRTTKGATLALHQGLLKNLNREEIEGVIGHELGHIKHKDFAVITTLAVIPLLAHDIYELLKDSPFWFAWIASPFPLLFYTLCLLCLRSLSRLREHYADAYSAYLTQSPRKLQSALAKITYGLSLNPKPKSEFGIRPFYIGDPAVAKKEFDGILRQKERYDLDRDGVLDERELHLAMREEAKQLTGKEASLKRVWRRINLAFSTHPPTYQRLLLLKEIEDEMARGYYTYERVYEHV